MENLETPLDAVQRLLGPGSDREDVTAIEFVAAEDPSYTCLRVEITASEYRLLSLHAAECFSPADAWIKQTLLDEIAEPPLEVEDKEETPPKPVYHPGVWLVTGNGDERLFSLQDWDKLKRTLESHEVELKTYFAATIGDRLLQVLRTRREHETKAVCDLKAFQDDVLVYLRAIALIAEMVGNAPNHREKDARLRGLVSQIETAIQRIRDGLERFTNSWWERPDVFRSDYPVRRYQEEIAELQREVKRLHATAPKTTGEKAESKIGGMDIEEFF